MASFAGNGQMRMRSRCLKAARLQKTWHVTRDEPRVTSRVVQVCEEMPEDPKRNQGHRVMRATKLVVLLLDKSKIHSKFMGDTCSVTIFHTENAERLSIS